MAKAPNLAVKLKTTHFVFGGFRYACATPTDFHSAEKAAYLMCVIVVVFDGSQAAWLEYQFGIIHYPQMRNTWTGFLPHNRLMKVFSANCVHKFQEKFVAKNVYWKCCLKTFSSEKIHKIMQITTGFCIPSNIAPLIIAIICF